MFVIQGFIFIYIFDTEQLGYYQGHHESSFFRSHQLQF